MEGGVKVYNCKLCVTQWSSCCTIKNLKKGGGVKSSFLLSIYDEVPKNWGGHMRKIHVYIWICAAIRISRIGHWIANIGNSEIMDSEDSANGYLRLSYSLNAACMVGRVRCKGYILKIPN